MELDDRFDQAVKKRNQLSREVERLKGRWEEALKNLKAVEEECRQKKFEPEQIDGVLEQLEQRYKTAVEALEKDNTETEQKLRPYLGVKNEN